MKRDDFARLSLTFMFFGLTISTATAGQSDMAPGVFATFPGLFKSRATGEVPMTNLSSNTPSLADATSLRLILRDAESLARFKQLMREHTILPFARIDSEAKGIHLELRGIVVKATAHTQRSPYQPGWTSIVDVRVKHIDYQCGPPSCYSNFGERLFLR